MFMTFFKVAPPSPPGSAFLRRRLRAANGDILTLQRVVRTTGGMRGYYFSKRSGIRAVDRDGVTRVVRQDADRVWLA